MVKFALEFWWKMLLTISPEKEARKSPSKLRRKFAANIAEKFANFTLEIAGAHMFVNSGHLPWENKRDSHRTLVPNCPRGKCHELAFLWFGLPG